MNIIPMSHIIFHNLQRFEMKIKHNGKHIVNLMQIINFQKLEKRFDLLNNFNPHLILKDGDLSMKGIENMKDMKNPSHFSFQS
jgi:hypothetical protein